MTKVHNDRIEKDGSDKGYSVRVGKTLPLNSANLAYVASPEVSPARNLQVNDLSANIKENGLPSTYETERTMFPAEDFLLRELAGDSKLPSKRVTLTDEFSVPSSNQERPAPLYYRATAKGMFDAKGALVSPYLSGYQEQPPERVTDYARVSQGERDNLLYLGTKIAITNLDGSPLAAGQKYKVHLVLEEGVGIPQNAYTIYVYTNFRGSDSSTFLLRYERYNADGTHTADQTEILNAYPFFDEISKSTLDELAANPKYSDSWRDELNDKVFSLVENHDNSYQVYAPSQVLVANNVTRPTHQFKYRVQANLKAKLSTTNPGRVNIGIVSLNTSVINVEDLLGTMKKLHEDAFKPPYLEFVNPHPTQKSYLKEDPRYWQVDLAMPAEQWNSYDLVVISGYGFYDMSGYNDAIRNYLENGGKLWIDNAGEVGKVLTFKSAEGKETFLSTVGFSNIESVSGFKTADSNEASQELLNRLYVLNGETLALGYENGTVKVNPKITYGSGESAASWTRIVRYSNNEPAVMQRAAFGKGMLLVSNCGIFRSLVYGKDNEAKLAMNIILTAAEKQWVYGPWVQDYVYHRDNLFREEYKEAGGTTAYVDERNDYDASQIVAKKVIAKTTRTALLPHLPHSHFSAKGTYAVEVQSNTEVAVPNASFEVGTYDSTEKKAVTEWTQSSAAVIPGWDTRYLAGDVPKFQHVTSSSQRGAKAIALDVLPSATGSHAYWAQTTPLLTGGSYRLKAWLRVEGASGITASGATIGVYDLGGTKIAVGTPLLGTRDWVEVTVAFSLEQAASVELRLGFVDGNGIGKVFMDYVSLSSIGSVYMTPENDGSRALYAYAVKPRGETFDLRAQGFSTADITTYDPEIEVSYTIRAFVHAWDNYAGAYMRKYGNSVTETHKLRRSDGVVSFGSLSTMLPALNGGSDWADVNDIYYEVYLGGTEGTDDESRFVNLEIYNAETGQYFFTKDGETIIRYMDLFYGGENPNILLQAHTNYYTIRATKRRYGVMVEAENKIQLAYPSTIDNRDCWFLRVQNGSFVKRELNYSDIKALLAYDNRYYEFQQRLFGTHHYALPEYKRQVFKPSIGIKRVRMETAEYVNETTVKVQDAPLYVHQGSMRKERLKKADTQGLVFQALNAEWSKTFVPRVYVDEDANGTEAEWISGFDIDYANGLVIFENPMPGIVRADYDYNNLEVWKRTYNNIRVRDEAVVSTDRRTFPSSHPNWLRFPTPIVRIKPYGVGEEKIAPVTTYTIDYSAGVVTFKEDIADRVTIEYTYSSDKRLEIKDFDARNGYIHLAEEIDFKQEIYVNYYYEESYLEYRGYYDAALGEFIHLDLNPSEGHYSTLPVVRTDTASGRTFTSWEAVPTSKLMNKEVYVYLLPYKDSFGNYNEHTVRHCYSIAEWHGIQKANPAALLLGVVQLREHTKVQDVVVMDTRSRGGGLRHAITDNDMKRIQPLSSSYWDMATWDGTAYYKNGVLIIELPKRILDTQGGEFTEGQVRETIQKYVAYGVYFIIEYI